MLYGLTNSLNFLFRARLGSMFFSQNLGGHLLLYCWIPGSSLEKLKGDHVHLHKRKMRVHALALKDK